METAFSPESLVLVCAAFILGGILKGASGVGAPFLAVPIMAILVDVPFAVATFLVPNIVSNAWQTWRYRSEVPDKRFVWTFALTAVVGAAAGTLALVGLSSLVLTTSVAVVVLAFVAFRLLNPGWSLSWAAAKRGVGPVGLIGGFFQGAIGLSGPIAITFMSAVGLPRGPFIFTMSMFFFAMTLVQMPLQVSVGVMTWDRFVLSCLAVAPLLGGMWIGEIIGRRLSRATFDRIILVLLTLLSLRLLAEIWI